MTSLISWLIDADYALKNALLKFNQRILFRLFSNILPIQKILVLRTGSIGDSICAIPAIENIRQNFPQSQIEVLTRTGGKDLVSISDLIKPGIVDRFIHYEGMNKSDLFKMLREQKYNLFIELTQVDTPFLRALRNQWIVKFLGIKYALGWEISATYLFPKFQEKHRRFPDETSRLLNMLKKNGLKTFFTGYSLGITPEQTQNVSTYFNKASDSKKNIGIAPGAKFLRNQWPIDYFKTLIRHFSDQNYQVFIFGGKEDVEKASHLLISDKVHNLCGKLTPLESIEAMKHCRLMITNDSGPLHMAVSANTPVLALFSSREYKGKWFPPDNGINKVLRSDNIPCSICVHHGCDDNICLKAIKPEEVISTVENLLRSL